MKIFITLIVLFSLFFAWMIESLFLGFVLGAILCWIVVKQQEQSTLLNQLNKEVQSLKLINQMLRQDLQDLTAGQTPSQPPLNQTDTEINNEINTETKYTFSSPYENEMDDKRNVVNLNTDDVSSANVIKVDKDIEVDVISDNCIHDNNNQENDHKNPIDKEALNQKIESQDGKRKVVFYKNNHQSADNTHCNDKDIFSSRRVGTHQDNIQDLRNTRDGLGFISLFVNWLSSGNPLLKVGMIVLFFGFIFLLKFVSTKIAIPIFLRYLMVGLFGLFCLLFGIKKYHKKPEYSVAIQGFGIAVMYLTALTALKLHGLLDIVTAFTLMAMLMVVLVYRAVKHDSQLLAQIAVIGAMAVPILTSSGEGSYVVLFSYLLLLTLGVAFIARIKAWRQLNASIFIGVVLIAFIWSKYYHLGYYLGVQLFLLAFWLVFTAIVVMYAKNKKESDVIGKLANNASLSEIYEFIKHYGLYVGKLDSSLLFGSAFVAFYFQYHLTQVFDEGVAISAFGFSVVYLLLAVYFRKAIGTFDLLIQGFFGLAVLFFIMGIGFLFEDSWLGTTWAIQAVLLYIFSMKQKQPYFRLFSLVLFIISSGVAFSDISWFNGYEQEILLSGSFIGVLFSFVCGFLIYIYYHREMYINKQNLALWEVNLQQVSLFITLMFLMVLPMMVFDYIKVMLSFGIIGLVLIAVNKKLPNSLFVLFSLIAGVSSSVFLCMIGSFDKNLMGYSVNMFAVMGMLAGVLSLLSAFLHHHNKNTTIGMASGFILLINHIFLLFISLFYYAKYNEINLAWVTMACFIPLVTFSQKMMYDEGKKISLSFILPLLMIPYFISFDISSLMICIGATTLYGFILRYQQKPYIWYLLLFYQCALFSFVLLWTVYFYFVGVNTMNGVYAQIFWVIPTLALWILCLYKKIPVPNVFKQVYYKFATWALSLAVMAFVFYVNWQVPQSTLSLPYLPVLNPLDLLSIAILLLGFLKLTKIEADFLPIRQVLAALGFFLLSAAIVRLWYFYGNVSWDLSSFLSSFGLQASLSLVWALCGIVLMVLANRLLQRRIWLSGAGLMGLVVVKLFLVDLGGSGGLARIISFIGVGLLLLLVGYFAPAPSSISVFLEKDEEGGN